MEEKRGGSRKKDRERNREWDIRGIKSLPYSGYHSVARPFFRPSLLSAVLPFSLFLTSFSHIFIIPPSVRAGDVFY